MLIREGADDRTLGRIYAAVVQAVMLYKSEMWVVILHIGRFWGVFLHRVAHRMAVRQPQIGWYSVWVYIPLRRDYSSWRPTYPAART